MCRQFDDKTPPAVWRLPDHRYLAAGVGLEWCTRTNTGTPTRTLTRRLVSRFAATTTEASFGHSPADRPGPTGRPPILLASAVPARVRGQFRDPSFDAVELFTFLGLAPAHRQ